MRNIHIGVSIPSQSTSLDSIDWPIHTFPSFHFYRAFYPFFTDVGSQSLEPSLIFIPCFQIQMSSLLVFSNQHQFRDSFLSRLSIIIIAHHYSFLWNLSRQIVIKRAFLDFRFTLVKNKTISIELNDFFKIPNDDELLQNT